MSSSDKFDTITISVDPVEFNWETGSSTGIMAQTIDTVDLSAVSITSTPAYTSIGTSSGSNGTWGAIGSVTLTDPYEEMEKRLARLEAIIEEEKRIRDECPAVKNAYDEYRLLLVLAKQHTTNVLTDE